ncbi:MAG: helix-turn-helix domain-containing protein [Cyclobacteriaceae bacterium]
MTLVPVNGGFKGQVDEAIGFVFEDNAVGFLYPKLIYPIFAGSMLFSLFMLFSSFRGKSLNIFLSGLILVIALYAFKNQLYGVEDGLTSYRYAIFTPISFILFIGPLLYFHIYSLLDQQFYWKKTYWIHLIPGTFFFLAYAVLAVAPEVIKEQFVFSHFDVSFSVPEQVLTILSGYVYSWLSYRKYLVWADQHKANEVLIKAWAPKLIFILIGLLTIWSITIILNFWLFDFGVTTLTNYPLWIACAIFLSWIAVEILLNPKFFLLRKSALLSGDGVISGKDLSQYTHRLESLMKEEKIYVDPNLNLEKLAAGLNINPRYLSSVLNNGIGKSFYDFVNAYRINEVKVMLRDERNQNLTIEAIANQAGFRSKSSFNTAFKRLTHMTPREYMRSHSEV